MSLDRRSFVATAATLAAAAVADTPSDAIARTATHRSSTDDPLGVRADFPVVNNRTFLNSAYIAPIPRQVVAAGHAFLEEKAQHSLQLGALLKECDDVRAQFARLIGATPAESGSCTRPPRGRTWWPPGWD